ncbi:MAG: hypothetical protein AAF223_23530 [Bacteroidota bacterium]
MNYSIIKPPLPRTQKKPSFNLPSPLKEGLKLVLVVVTNIIALAVIITRPKYEGSITLEDRYHQLLKIEQTTHPPNSTEEMILRANPALAELNKLLAQRKALQFVMNDLMRSPAPMQAQRMEYERKRCQQRIQRLEQRITYLLKQQKATYAKRQGMQ